MKTITKYFMQAVLVVGLMVLSFAGAAASEWTVTDSTINASAGQSAMVRNELGDRLYVWRKPGTSPVVVYGELHLGEGRRFTPKTPFFQIDQGDTIRLDKAAESATGDAVGWVRTAATYMMWKVRESDNNLITEQDPLNQWLNGDYIKFIYVDENGVERTTGFSLTGSRSNIIRAAGLDILQ